MVSGSRARTRSDATPTRHECRSGATLAESSRCVHLTQPISSPPCSQVIRGASPSRGPPPASCRSSGSGITTFVSGPATSSGAGVEVRAAVPAPPPRRLPPSRPGASGDDHRVSSSVWTSMPGRPGDRCGVDHRRHHRRWPHPPMIARTRGTAPVLGPLVARAATVTPASGPSPELVDPQAGTVIIRRLAPAAAPSPCRRRSPGRRRGPCRGRGWTVRPS